MTDDVSNAETWASIMRAEFETLDVEQALQTMTAEPCVNHVPTMTGGFGAAELGDSIATTSSANGRRIPR